MGHDDMRNGTTTLFAALSVLEGKMIGRFHAVVDLQAAIKRFIAETSENSKPFVWTKGPNKIIAAVRRGHQVLGSIH